MTRLGEGRRVLPVLAGLMLLAACDDEPEAATDRTEPAGEASSAAVAFQVEPLEYEFVDGRHRFYQVRRFEETAGVGVTLTRGRVCVADGEECVESEVEYRIDAHGVFVQERHYVATLKLPDTATITYWGVDDNGGEFELSRTLALDKP